jgi:hypothetical protein
VRSAVPPLPVFTLMLPEPPPLVEVDELLDEELLDPPPVSQAIPSSSRSRLDE